MGTLIHNRHINLRVRTPESYADRANADRIRPIPAIVNKPAAAVSIQRRHRSYVRITPRKEKRTESIA